MKLVSGEFEVLAVICHLLYTVAGQPNKNQRLSMLCLNVALLEVLFELYTLPCRSFRTVL